MMGVREVNLLFFEFFVFSLGIRISFISGNKRVALVLAEGST